MFHNKKGDAGFVRWILVSLTVLLLVLTPFTQDRSLAETKLDVAPSLLCSMSPHLVKGQPFKYPGGTSGITHTYSDTKLLGRVEYGFLKADNILTAEDINNISGGNLVEILIVDDFTTTPSEEYLLSHGDYVFQVAMQYLDELVSGSNIDSQVNPQSLVCDPNTVSDEECLVREVNYGNGQLILKAVDIAGYDVQTIIDTLNALPPDKYYVVNMSFAVLPCAVIANVSNEEDGAVVGTGNPYFDPGGDLIINFSTDISSDPQYPPDLSTLNETQWRIVKATSPQLQALELESGDIIEAFEFTPDLAPRQALNGAMLWGELMQLNSNTEIRIWVTEKEVIDINPSVLYKALVGDSITLRLVEQYAVQHELELLPREYATLQGQYERALAEQLNLQAIDPLQGVLADLPDNVIPVAAAGNFDGIRPLIPGAWEEVISVAGSIVKGEITLTSQQMNFLAVRNPQATRWPDSNTGQVMAPAGWYRVPCQLQPKQPDGSDRCEFEFVSGTSFATPATSVLIAVSLDKPMQYCADYTDVLASPSDASMYFDTVACPQPTGPIELPGSGP